MLSDHKPVVFSQTHLASVCEVLAGFFRKPAGKSIDRRPDAGRFSSALLIATTNHNVTQAVAGLGPHEPGLNTKRVENWVWWLNQHADFERKSAIRVHVTGVARTCAHATGAIANPT